MRKIFLLTPILLASCWTIPEQTTTPLADTLEIKSVQPRAADAGEPVTISGAGFVKNLSVKIGSQSVTPTTITDKQLTLIMPNLGRGQYRVEVKNPNGVSVTHRGPVVLGKDNLTTTGPNSVPSIIEGQVMISIPQQIPGSNQTFETKEALENYFKTNFPNFNVRVLQFYASIVPGSAGPCGKTLAVLESTDGESTKAVLNELSTKFPELNDLELLGDGHSNYAGGGLQAQDTGDTAPDWSHRAVNMPNQTNLIDLAEKLSSIKVAVLDTGISDHIEFELNEQSVIDRSDGRNFTSEGLFENPGSTQDGYTPDVLGIPQLEEAGGHGTPIAAIIAALNGNQGVESSAGFMVGVAAGVHVIPIKVCYRAKGGSRFEMPPPYCPGIGVAAGICQAIAKGAQIINLSLGGPQSGLIMNSILQEAAKKDISIIAAAGNNSSSDEHFPAAFGTVSQKNYDVVPGLIAVGATISSYDPKVGTFQKIVGYSNRGPWVDLMAPGGEIGGGFRIKSAANFRVDNSPDYNFFEGTSFAAPLVTGTVALLRAKFPTLTAGQIKDKIKVSATKMSCSSTVCGTGLLNISKSLGIPQNSGTTLNSRP
jgi:subtilisin family serine protease